MTSPLNSATHATPARTRKAHRFLPVVAVLALETLVWEL